MSEIDALPLDAPLAGAGLRALRGIGPAVEQRLRQAGITTYTQLAARSPEELAEVLAGLVGLTAERIRQYDWAGQCAQLAASPAEANPPPRMRYATYTVELLLDEMQHSRRTRVTHIQTGSEQSWAGWDAQRLADLITQTAGLAVELPAERVQPADNRPAPEAAEVFLPAGTIGEQAGQPIPHAPVPELRLERVEFLPRGAGDTGRLLRHDAPFDVALALEFGNSPAQLSYRALVHARNLSQGANTIVVRAEGQLTAAARVTLMLQGGPLPPGVYRTEALVVVSETRAGGTLRQSAMLEGGLVQVY